MQSRSPVVPIDVPLSVSEENSIDPYLRFKECSAVEIAKQIIGIAELCFIVASTSCPFYSDKNKETGN